MTWRSRDRKQSIVKGSWCSSTFFSQQSRHKWHESIRPSIHPYIYIYIGLYALQLLGWLRAFPKEQIKIVHMDDMKTPPRLQVRSIDRYLLIYLFIIDIDLYRSKSIHISIYHRYRSISIDIYWYIYYVSIDAAYRHLWLFGRAAISPAIVIRNSRGQKCAALSRHVLCNLWPVASILCTV
jgi:hypothetical protein